MAKDPAFLFYPGDWLGGTMSFSRHHKGAYMDLLMAQFNQGHMALEDIEIILGSDFNLMWESKLKSKFKSDESGKFFNEKLEGEIIKRKNYTFSRRENLAHKKVDIIPHMDEHMENENVIVNEVINYLNEKALTKFKSSSEKTKKIINARVNEKYTLSDFKKVIDIKCSKWINDPKMVSYLRPETLFGSKFEGYLNEKIVNETHITTTPPITGNGYGKL